MHSALLRTKLYRPAPPPTAIPRPVLLQRLQDGLHGQVTLVSAPAGFGKSTIVSQWMDQLEAQAASSHTPSLATCWLAIEELDNQLPRFTHGLVAAIEEKFPASCAIVTAIVNSPQPPTIEALADTLLDALSRIPSRLIVVLDDLHSIDDASVYAFLAHLIQHSSNRLHLVLITRIDPPLPLNRWRAQGRMNELRLQNLSFTLVETATFLHGNLERRPSAAMVKTLHERTEGWSVGLRLVVLALRTQPDYAEFTANIEAAGSRYIVDYLVDDVLEHQPPALQEFLICTAILDRFCADLCATLLGVDESVAQQHINYVVRNNIFLVELGSPPFWYRYHHQFQSMLLSRLHERHDRIRITELHHRAAGWLAAHNQSDEALHHLIAIPDYDAAVALIEAQRVAALNEQRFHDLEGWLALVPVQLVNRRPALLISHAWACFDQLDSAACLATAQRAERLLSEHAAALPPETHQILRAELVAMRTALDSSLRPDEALALIRASWTLLRPHLTLTHCNVSLWFAYTSQRLGDAKLALEIVLTTLEGAGMWPMVTRCRLLHTAGFLYWCEGNLAQAERTFQENLRQSKQYHLPLIATISHHGLGAIADARNQLDAAEAHHLEALKNPSLNNGREAVMELYSLLGIYARDGRFETGRAELERLKTHAALMGRPYLLNQTAGLEAYFAMLCGDMAAALRWALTGSRGEMYNGADRIPLIRAQIWLAEGSSASLQAALKILLELGHRHEREHSWHRLVEVHILQALAWAKLGKNESALAALAKAVQRAVPNGMVGPFIAQGQMMQSLLQQLGQQPAHTDHVRLLLAAYPDASLATPPIAPTLESPDPLTDRELDILNLLGDRLSNKEIAKKLTLSTHTVRNHVANIFDKLQVVNRIQAVQRARELGLLPPVPRRITPV